MSRWLANHKPFDCMHVRVLIVELEIKNFKKKVLLLYIIFIACCMLLCVSLVFGNVP